MIPKTKLERLYKSGLSMEEISQKEDWTYQAVKYWATKHNIPRRSASETCYRTYWSRQKENPSSPDFYKAVTVEVIRELYYKKKLSAREVGKVLGRSINSIYGFMKRHNLPRRASAETNNIRYERQAPSYNLKQNLTSGEEKLKIAGIMLYWAEGSKAQKVLGTNRKRHVIDLANSNPKMIKLFLKFLRRICGVDEQRLRVNLYCYANQNVDSLKKYWCGATGIPLKQFIRPYIRNDFLPEKSGKMEYGLIHVVYSDKKLFLQIKDWTNQYLNKTI
ncbi:MAG: hypothetical protein ISS84_00685 [Candidatus Pacebacteria bacterium]|nr:hypothetical protein [Candidatus Paceibacterota bacterium]